MISKRKVFMSRWLGACALAVIPAVSWPGPARAQDVLRDLHVFAYVHDDVSYSDEELLGRHFAPWQDEMRRVIPEREIHIHLRRRVAGITDHWYGKRSALSQWERAVIERAWQDEPVKPGARERFNLLLVGNPYVLPSEAGVTTAIGGRYGFASVNATPLVAGHELGHMMGADHDVAARFEAASGAVCATIMWERAGEYADCGHYSIRNTERIQDQSRFWDASN